METFAYAMRKLDELNKELAPIAAATAEKATEGVPSETADAPSVDPDIYDQSGEASRPNQRGVRPGDAQRPRDSRHIMRG
jgi:hypothetical protein